MASSEVQLCINSRVEYVSCPRVELISLAVVADEGVLHWKLDASYFNLVQELYSVEGLEGIYVYTYSFRIYLQHIWAICVTYAPTIVFSHMCKCP